MLNLKLFSPLARTGTKDRLERRLAKEHAAHERAEQRIMRQMEFLALQLRERRVAKAAVAAARSELAIDAGIIEIEATASLLMGEAVFLADNQSADERLAPPPPPFSAWAS